MSTIINELAPSRYRRWPMKLVILIFLLMASPILAQQSAPLQGSWTASAGPNQIFNGMWSAEISAQSRNSARGSWTLINDAGQVILQGTWSARKTGGGWNGTWTARAARGAAMSGSWSADLPASAGKTMQDMLQQATTKEAAGSWQAGRRQGHWWLKSLNSSSRR